MGVYWFADDISLSRQECRRKLTEEPLATAACRGPGPHPWYDFYKANPLEQERRFGSEMIFPQTVVIRNQPYA